MQALSKHANTWETKKQKKTNNGSANQRARNKYRHAWIKTRLLFSVAKNKESKTKGKNNMTGT